MGGLKRKVPMEKIEKKDSRAVAFSKRRMGLYGKASELCLLSGAKIAILATPISSKSNVSFYSFGGNSSVDCVVSSFLANQRPPEDLGLGFWWEDESLVKSENPVELRETADSMSRLMNDLKELRSNLEKKKNDVVLNETHQDQTLNLCFQNDFEDFVKNIEEEMLEISVSDNNNGLSGNLEGSLAIHRDLDEEQTLAISDNNNNGLSGDFGGCNEELYLDQNFDFEMTSEILSMNLEMNDASMVTTNQNPCSGFKSAEDGPLMMMHRDLDEENLHFSDFFNSFLNEGSGLTSINFRFTGY